MRHLRILVVSIPALALVAGGCAWLRPGTSIPRYNPPRGITQAAAPSFYNQPVVVPEAAGEPSLDPNDVSVRESPAMEAPREGGRRSDQSSYDPMVGDYIE